MLVLTRRLGEEIVIDGHIRVTILSVKGDRVRLGVSAPESMRVDRSEVHERRREFESSLPDTSDPSLGETITPISAGGR